MQLGMIGLGRMGGSMRARLRRAGHDVIGYDPNPDVTDVPSLPQLVERLTTPRVMWIMVPVQFTEPIIDELKELLSEGDIVIDGGNSKFSDDPVRAQRLGERGIGYLDVGVSGGVWGLESGYALMVGGSDEQVARVQPIFDGLKPEGEFGFVHAGPVGAGHYAKMVHNGIEYGLMQSYAEGYELLEASEFVNDVPAVIKSWREGSVVKSWLLDLFDRTLSEDPKLAQLRGYADDTGEGRWTVEEAIRLAVPMHVIAASLFDRFTSRQDDSPAMKAVAALRNRFGGHPIRVK